MCLADASITSITLAEKQSKKTIKKTLICFCDSLCLCDVVTAGVFFSADDDILPGTSHALRHTWLRPLHRSHAEHEPGWNQLECPFQLVKKKKENISDVIVRTFFRRFDIHHIQFIF